MLAQTIVRGVSARLLLALLIGAWTLLAAPRPAAAEAAPRILEATAKVAAHNALIVELRVRTDVPAGIVVTYGNREAGTFRIARPSNGTTEQVVKVMRLRAEAEYGFVVYASVGEQWSAPAVGQFRTGALPEVLKQWRFDVVGRPTFELLFSSFMSGGHTGLVALDATGAVVWYYHMPGGMQMQGARQLANGEFAAIVNGLGLIHLANDGRVIRFIEDRKGETFTHRDLEILPDGHVLILTDLAKRLDLTKIGKGTDELVAISSLRDVHLESGATRVVWSAVDSIDPLTEVHVPSLRPLQGTQIDPALDWLHLNSISRGPRGNYLVSSPFTDAVYSISSDFRRIEWRLGGTKSDFRFEDPNDRFYYQHSASELPNGNILLFDNGGARWTSHRRPDEVGAYSRAVEYALDRQTMTAKKVWEYRHTPDAAAPIISSVDRLANGNSLVNFGVAPVRVVEVDPQQRPVWSLTYAAEARFQPPVDVGALTLQFEAHTMDALNGEVRLAAAAR